MPAKSSLIIPYCCHEIHFSIDKHVLSDEIDELMASIAATEEKYKQRVEELDDEDRIAFMIDFQKVKDKVEELQRQKQLESSTPILPPAGPQQNTQQQVIIIDNNC